MDNKTSQANVQSGKVLAALCYFSIFFAPLILPIIVWILSDKPTSSHAAKSLIYHIITYLCPFILVISAKPGYGCLINSINLASSCTNYYSHRTCRDYNLVHH
jgi:uncharacterized Tic20 family protein